MPVCVRSTCVHGDVDDTNNTTPSPGGGAAPTRSVARNMPNGVIVASKSCRVKQLFAKLLDATISFHQSTRT